MITGTTLVNALGLNGAAFAHQPTSHHWLDRDTLGTDGNGIPVYVAPRQYEMKWDFINTEEFTAMYAYFQAQGVTGTVTATLPKWNGNQYQFQNYSGCTIKELTYDDWFENNYAGVRLIITRINQT